MLDAEQPKILSGLKVLLVEDEMLIALLAEDMLVELERISTGTNRGGFPRGGKSDPECGLGYGGQHAWVRLSRWICARGFWPRLMRE